MERARVDRPAPIMEIFEMVQRSLHSAYIPKTFVTIDEHLCRYQGRCQFLQYMPNNLTKYGLKHWILAYERKYYPLNIEAYTGKNLSLSNKPEDVTLRLTKFKPWSCN